MFVPRVGEIDVFEEGSNIPMSHNNGAWAAVESLVDMALCIHETPQGTNLMIDIGQRTVQLLGTRHTLGPRAVYDMPRHVSRFLHLVRQRFPNIYTTTDDYDAATSRCTWGDDPAQYDPKTAAEISIRKFVSAPVSAQWRGQLLIRCWR